MDNVIRSSRTSILAAARELEAAEDALNLYVGRMAAVAGQPEGFALHSDCFAGIVIAEYKRLEQRVLDAHGSWAELAYHVQ